MVITLTSVNSTVSNTAQSAKRSAKGKAETNAGHSRSSHDQSKMHGSSKMYREHDQPIDASLQTRNISITTDRFKHPRSVAGRSQSHTSQPTSGSTSMIARNAWFETTFWDPESCFDSSKVCIDGAPVRLIGAVLSLSMLLSTALGRSAPHPPHKVVSRYERTLL